MTRPLATVNRRVYAALIGDHATEAAAAELAWVDAYADEALDVLFAEEPSLLHWVETDQGLRRLLGASVWGSYAVMVDGLSHGRDLHQIAHRLVQLTRRIAVVAAYHAVCADRDAIGHLRLPQESENV